MNNATLKKLWQLQNKNYFFNSPQVGGRSISNPSGIPGIQSNLENTGLSCLLYLLFLVELLSLLLILLLLLLLWSSL